MHYSLKNYLNTTEIARDLGMTKNRLVFEVGLSSCINKVSYILQW